MSKKIEDLTREMIDEVVLEQEHPWQQHIKKSLQAAGKSLGKMNDAESKEFFKKAKATYKKGHSDEELKAKHNNEAEEIVSSALMVLEQIKRMRVASDHQYGQEIKELQTDLLNLGFTETLAQMLWNNKKFTEQTDPSKIKVKHPGILNVPEGKDVDKLPASHFIGLAKKEGREPVVKALMNLYRWNKGKAGDRGQLAGWAKGMQEKVSAAMEKAEK